MWADLTQVWESQEGADGHRNKFCKSTREFLILCVQLGWTEWSNGGEVKKPKEVFRIQNILFRFFLVVWHHSTNTAITCSLKLFEGFITTELDRMKFNKLHTYINSYYTDMLAGSILSVPRHHIVPILWYQKCICPCQMCLFFTDMIAVYKKGWPYKFTLKMDGYITERRWKLLELSWLSGCSIFHMEFKLPAKSSFFYPLP